ncbi:MAG: EpsG family protein [Bacillota bacterium]
MSVPSTIALYVSLIVWAVVIMQLTQAVALRLSGNSATSTKSSRLIYALGFAAACLPFIVILSVRYQVGTDTPIYINRFEEFSSIQTVTEFFEKTKAMEPGFVLLNKLTYGLGGDARMLFAVSALIMFIAFGKGLWDFSHLLPVGLAALFIFSEFVPHSFNIMRQMIAVSLVWASLKPLLDKKFKIFLLYIALAMLFHYTAAFIIPFYFACGEKRGNHVVACLIWSACIFFYLSYVFLFDYIPASIIKLSDYFIKEGSLKLSTLIIRIPLFIPYLFYKRIVQLNPNYRVFFLFLWIELVFASLSNYSPNLNRISLYFRLSWIILVPLTVRSMPNRKWNTALALLYVVYSAILFNREFINFNYGQWIPYAWNIG